MFQGVEAPEFLDNRHMKVVMLSSLRTGRLYPQESARAVSQETDCPAFFGFVTSEFFRILGYYAA
jgi:hypothetical protein